METQETDGTSTTTEKPKRTRTASPEAQAMRLAKEVRKLKEKVASEADRHNERLVELAAEKEKIDEKRDALDPVARDYFDRWVEGPTKEEAAEAQP